MNRDDLVRDTYAHFGLAIYMAQVLEQAIVTTMVVARMPDRATSRGKKSTHSWIGSSSKRSVNSCWR